MKPFANLKANEYVDIGGSTNAMCPSYLKITEWTGKVNFFPLPIKSIAFIPPINEDELAMISISNKFGGCNVVDPSPGLVETFAVEIKEYERILRFFDALNTIMFQVNHE